MKKRHLFSIVLALCCSLTASSGTFVRDGIVYMSTCDSTVTVTKVYDNEWIIIPGMVSDGQRSYTVTSISEGAFYLLLHARTVVLPGTIRRIDGMAFNNCKAISDLHVLAGNPPECGKDAFHETNVHEFTLHVPHGSTALYGKLPPWNMMKTDTWNSCKDKKGKD